MVVIQMGSLKNIVLCLCIMQYCIVNASLEIFGNCEQKCISDFDVSIFPIIVRDNSVGVIL